MLDDRALKSSLETGVTLPVYIIAGEDVYLKKQALDRIIAATVEPGDDMNLIRFAHNVELQQVYDELNGFPIMADKKCVVLVDYDINDADKSDFENLLELAGDPVDTSVFVIYFGNTEIDFKKSDRFKKLMKSVESGGGVVCELNHKTETELAKLLCSSAAKRLRKLEPAVAKYMITVCGTDLNILINEIEKLCSFTEENAVIEKETVDLICVKTIEASVYDISRFLLQGKPEKVYHSLNNLLAEGVLPTEIHALIASAYVDIFRVKAAVDAGKKPESIAADFGYPTQRAFVLSNAARDGRYLTQRDYAGTGGLVGFTKEHKLYTQHES